MVETLLKTKRYIPPTERQLSMDRSKPRSMGMGAMYRLFHAGNALFGSERMTKLLLNASRLFARFAFELSSASYGENFHNVSMALSEEILCRHIPSGGTVLDVGCGYGRASRMAAKFAASVYDAKTGKLIVSTDPAYGFSREDDGVVLFLFDWDKNDMGVDFKTNPPKVLR